MKNLILSLFILLSTFSLSADQSDNILNETNWFDVAKSGSVDLMQGFIQSGIDVNAYDSNSLHTELMKAIESRNIDAGKVIG